MTTLTSGRRPRALAAAVAVLACLALLLSACSSSSSGGGGTNPTTTSGSAQGGGSSSKDSSSSAPSTTAAPKPTGKPVHMKSLFDGGTYGVGLPMIVFFNKQITNAKALQQATTVEVNGSKVDARWYFEQSSYYQGYPIEGHIRMQTYWPAHSHVTFDIAAKGLSAGHDLVFDNSLTLSFDIGDQNIATVDDTTHKLTLVTNGTTEGTYPVSLGANQTPTRSGTKVIMEKGASICMSGPGYDECGVKFTQRLTYDGEYLHAAPWNISNIENGVDSSNGCTNLLPADAQKLFGLLEIGDVVKYPNANGGAMTLGEGYGDWNVSWGQWETGGLAPTE